MQNSLKTTDWSLKGATYLENNTFSFVGDMHQDKIMLLFEVNGAEHRIELPDTLKQVGDWTDEIKDGVVYYRIKQFFINQYNVLKMDATWSQNEHTVICYCQLPYDLSPDTLILCDKQLVIDDTITKSDRCGVKKINNVLAIRLSREALRIGVHATPLEILDAFNAYFKQNPFSVLYLTTSPLHFTLENYAFSIQDVNNVIVPISANKPSFFEVHYPLEIIINTTVDVQEVLAIKDELIALKQDFDSRYDVILEHHQTIIAAHEEILAASSHIDILYNTIITADADIKEIATLINSINAEVKKTFEDIKTLAETIDSALHNHNNDRFAHQDIRTMLEEVAHADYGDF